MKAKHSYFDKQLLEHISTQLKGNPDAPEWLAKAVDFLGERHDEFPVEDDENRFVIEFIYPH